MPLSVPSRISAPLRLCASLLFLSSALLQANPEQLEFFEAKVRPVLIEHCYNCHSTEAEKLKGGLLLDSREGWQTTGDSGPSIVPGDPEASLFITAIRYEDPDMEMPPKKRLAPEVVADLEAWVRMGAPDPREAPSGGFKIRNVLYDPKDADAHWAFQPIQNPEVPKLNHPWIQTPIDAFLLQEMQKSGVEPSSPADPRDLLRRVSYDLTGLPPTQEETTAFAEAWKQDPTTAFQQVTERLLGSPQYGVKYGRHWLDLARYADTNGNRLAPTAPNPYYPYAWSYRDYVIEAMNEDVPYDRFVQEQLAGDHLASSADPNPYAAQGFLRVGKVFGQNMNDRIDDRIDALSKTFLGLTVSCARCHDHKFDPVYQSDYYALHGILSSTEDVDIEMARPSQAFTRLTDKMLSDARQEARDNINEFISEMAHRSADFLIAAQQFRAGKLKEKLPELAAREVNLKPIPFEAWIEALTYWEETENRVMSPWFAYAAAEPTEFATITDRIRTGDIVTNPLVAAKFSETPASLEDVAQRYQELAIETEGVMEGQYPLTEIIVELVSVQRRWIAEEYNPFANKPRALEDPEREELRRVLLGFEGPWGGPRMPPQQLARSGAGDFKGSIKMAMHEIQKLHGEHPEAPKMAMAMQDVAKPANSPIFIRGSADNPGEEVPRAFLEHLAGPDASPYDSGSGRSELAQDIVDRNNPLTARVIVNRVWQWHFGTGLVTTPSDFGLNGTPPSHPELLDWMATWFMDEAGWSLKELHKLILRSSAYQQSAQPRSELADIDPGNTLFWRFPPRQLIYEELRDTILLHTGKLDLEHLSGRPDKSEDSTRRSLFLYVDRMDLPYENQIFDFANPDFSTSERESSIVAPQALFFLNSPRLMDQAAAIAERTTGPTNSRLVDLYQTLLQRGPSRTEVELAKGYLQSNGDDWARLTHALLTTNELMFVY